MRRRASFFVLFIFIIFSLVAPQALAESSAAWDKDNPGVLDTNHLYSRASIVMDARTKEVLFADDTNVAMYPASTTKIMTLLLALESDISLDSIVTIPDGSQNVPSDSSLIPVFSGEEMMFKDLLYGFMINSGNDGANAIAMLTSGSIEQFVQQMNARAQEIGCENTHFSNAHGYHDESHYTTAYDLALITQVALRNEAFRDIVSCTSYTMASTVNRGPLTVTTSVDLLKEGNNYYEYCIGVKTGFTSKAGQCFVGAAKRDGVTLITVALNSTVSSSEKTKKWQDTFRLFEYGFAQYEPHLLMEIFSAASKDVNTISIDNAAKDDTQKGLLKLRLTQLSDADFSLRIRGTSTGYAEALADFAKQATVTINEGLQAPIDEGEIVGTLTYAMDNGDVLTAMLTADREVKARPDQISLYDVMPFLKPMQSFFDSGAALYVLLIAGVVVFIILLRRIRRRAVRDRRRQEIYDIKRREYNKQEAMRRRESEHRRREALKRRRETQQRSANRSKYVPPNHAANRSKQRQSQGRRSKDAQSKKDKFF